MPHYENETVPVIHARPLLAAQSQLGEGSIWNPFDSKLYWVDIEGCTLHIYDPSTKEDRHLPTGARIGTVVPMADGDVLVALQSGIHRMDTVTGTLQLLVNPMTAPDLRFNDGKCDPSGRFWAGTMSLIKTKGAGTLYCLDGDGILREMLQEVTISNGIVWIADRQTMYYIDTPTRTVQAFDYDDFTGNISKQRIAFEIPEGNGFPDGMAIDADDNLWIAMWGAGTVNKYDPATGKLLQQIIVPAPHVASCAFGGAGLRTLYITTARVELTAEALKNFPQSGDLFFVETDVAGAPTNFYLPAKAIL